MAEQALLSLGQEFRFHFQGSCMVHLCSSRSGLDVAEVGGLAEGGKGVAVGTKLVGDVAAEVGGGDAAHYAVPLDFLGASIRGGRDAAGVKWAIQSIFFWMVRTRSLP